MARGPQRRGAQCGCIGLRPALDPILRKCLVSRRMGHLRWLETQSIYQEVFGSIRSAKCCGEQLHHSPRNDLRN